MCGIVGAVSQRDVINILLEGLLRLEYRGYDSAGFSIIDYQNNITRLRCVGKVQNLIEAMKNKTFMGRIGIAHTRWATHGQPSEINAHPHMSEHISIVHNGIVENYEKIRTSLIDNGYQFTSQTDTEVVAHLVHWEHKKSNGGTLREALLRVISQLRGMYSMVIMDSHDPSRLIAVSHGSTLVVGIGNNENFVASDPIALLPVTRKFIYLKEGDIADITPYEVNFINLNGQQVKRSQIESDTNYDINDKGCYHHYMHKEIYEQPKAIKNTLINRINNNNITLTELDIKAKSLIKATKHIQIVGCGTSYNAGMVSRYWFESLANISCGVDIASEYRYRKAVVHKNSLFIAISQSGETADTLAALRLSKTQGYIGSLVICNMEDSSLIREADIVIMTKAGIEISVASTKSFTTQLTALLILVIKLGSLHGMQYGTQLEIMDALQKLPNRIEHLLTYDKIIQKLAKDFSNKNNVLFLGRGIQYPIAMEGALKLKEISYIHAEAYAAGELKHGPLALIDAHLPVIVLAPNNNLLEKLQSNIEEIKARKGLLYIFADENIFFEYSNTIKVISLPYIEEVTAPIFYIIVLQLLAYHVALVKKVDIDRPRNLAKSVTVE